MNYLLAIAGGFAAGGVCFYYVGHAAGVKFAQAKALGSQAASNISTAFKDLGKGL